MASNDLTPRPPGEELRRGLLLLALATVVLFIGLVITGVVGWAILENRADDIQRGRLESCQRTYQSYIDVFRPFFPEGPPIASNKNWTAEQIENWENLNRTIRRKKTQCPSQIHAD